jgi:plastocyanin
MKKWLGVLIFMALLTILISACSIGQSDNNTAGNGQNIVDMDDLTFKLSSITINKGESVNLINDAMVVHVIANGTWDGSTPKPKIEPGAPKIDNIQIGGNATTTIGPFNTAGTFQIYCTVHQGMKMSIIVK